MSEFDDIVNPDGPEESGMADIFALPDYIAADERVLRWYNDMVEGLRKEAQGVPMRTAQYTLMERIAFFYASMRYNELNNIAQTARERREANTAWLSMLDLFNRLLEKHNDKVVNEMLVAVQKIVLDGLDILEDPIQKASLRRFYSEKFAAIDN